MLNRVAFKAYRRYAQRLEKLKSEPDTVTDTVKGSSPEPPYTQRTVTVCGMDARKKAKIEALEGLMAEVEAEIALAPESLKAALWLRYVEGLAWDQVGQRVGKNPDACRMSCQRYMKKARP